MRKIKERKEVKAETEEIDKAKLGIITVFVIVVTFAGFYFLTSYLLERGRTNYPTGESLSSEKYIPINKILSQEEEEYYVLAVFAKDPNKKIYNMYFEAGKDLEVYYVDMSDTFNKSYIGEETNISNTIKEIELVQTTLMVIKNGKIVSHYVGKADISTYLTSQIEVEQ